MYHRNILDIYSVNIYIINKFLCVFSGDIIPIRKSQRIKDIQEKKIKESSSSEATTSRTKSTKKRRRLSRSKRDTKRSRKN